MKQVNIELRSIYVTLRVPDEMAAKITSEDVREMAMSAINAGDAGLGVTVMVEGKAQFEDEERKEAVFADAFVDYPSEDDFEINVGDDGFDKLDEELDEELGA